MTASFRAAGIAVDRVYIDTRPVGAVDVTSVFVPLPPMESRLTILETGARDVQDDPVLVVGNIADPEADAADEDAPQDEIVGFLENRHAVVLRPGQPVRGSISDARTGAQIVFQGHLLQRDFSTVDTAELGIRLGNQSLAGKMLRLGGLSQVVVGVDPEAAAQIRDLPGAVVQLTFPLARQSLFNFLLNRDAAI
ncbi:hypothetical protein [Chachezhania sediminis]|uniref:hypothetical protein n=1 Tax=Chachezhania sediminis TaxID=2599291 RepID=UPI00131CAAC9|nr:hypothetical protein [Chachezhania sediminis]